MPDAGDALPPFAAAYLAPVGEERTVEGPFPVEGAIPPVLEGLLVRIGPNPYPEPDAPTTRDPLVRDDGDGMVHAVELRAGKAVSYRNRWVRTRALAARAGTPAPPGPLEPVDGPANCHVLWYAGRLLALGGTGFPVRLTPGLATVRIDDLDAMLTSPLAPHPHLDPDGRGMALWGDDPFGPPYLRYHEADAGGTLVHSTDIACDRPTVHHDAAVSAAAIAFFDQPVVLRPDLAARGAPVPRRYDPDRPTRVGVLARGGTGDRIRWTAVDPCVVAHVVNAFDDGGALVVDLCRADTYAATPLALAPRLERWRVEAHGVEATALDDRVVDLPRVDPTLAGRPYRFAYLAERGLSGLVRYDLVADEAVRWDPGAGRAAGEPLFVRDPEGHRDDEGWVLTVVYDAGRDASDLVVLDASRFGGRPEAVVHLPARVPWGRHGSWVPAARYR